MKYDCSHHPDSVILCNECGCKLTVIDGRWERDDLAEAQRQHETFDQLMASYLMANHGKTPSTTTLSELMTWSYARIVALHAERAERAVRQ